MEQVHHLATTAGSSKTPLPGCSWPPHLISQSRDLDFTECFERAVLLPVPLLLTFLAAIAQIFSIRRRLGRPLSDGGIAWTTRSARSERICRAKVVSLAECHRTLIFQALLAISTILGLASLALSLDSVRSQPLSCAHYGLYTLTLIALIHLTYLNHHTARRSADIVLLFWPLYTLASVVRLRTMIITGELSPHHNHTDAERIALARQVLWLSSIGVGLVDFMLELYSPEKRWKRWRAPWSRAGKIALSDDEEEEEARDTVDGLNGGGAVGGWQSQKNEDGEMESPVLTANIYERPVIRDWPSRKLMNRLTFSWLTRM